MPISFGPALSRRRFIQTAVAAAGHLLTVPVFAIRSPSAKQTAPRWAFVSDTHVPQDRRNTYRGFRPYDNFKSVVGMLYDLLPEGVIITGDVARLEGLRGDYANVRRLIETLKSKTPIHICLGNHDDRRNFLAVLGDLPGERQPVEGKYVTVIHTGEVRFVLLDSLLYVNKVAGLLGKTQRIWLTRYLDQADNRPTLLFFHHTLGDGDGDLLDVDRLLAIVRPHLKVKALVFGHSHEYRYDIEHGIHLVNLPATGYNFSDDHPVGWVEATVTREGADLTLRTVGGNFRKANETTSLAWRS